MLVDRDEQPLRGWLGSTICILRTRLLAHKIVLCHCVPTSETWRSNRDYDYDILSDRSSNDQRRCRTRNAELRYPKLLLDWLISMQLGLGNTAVVEVEVDSILVTSSRGSAAANDPEPMTHLWC